VREDGILGSPLPERQCHELDNIFLPDGFSVEVIWHKPGVPDAETLPRADWTTVELS
jgi:hypothetical protein